MKAFRGTLIAAALLLLVLVAVKLLDKSPTDTQADQALDRPIFVFEKQDLRRVEVLRPGGEVVALSETDEGWILEGEGFQASTTMVNRFKHQLHDLTARAQVIDAPEDAALYGLGSQAIQVTLIMRDGSELKFRSGDPNPSAVSYYIQPEPGDTIYTVKKSAVDYYSLGLDEFRERRFASFDSKDADAIEADLPGGGRLLLQRSGEQSWELLEPVEMLVARDKARGLLGRIAVLKAKDFVEDYPETGDRDLAQYGLEEPRARITIRFGDREPLKLLVGDSLPVEGPRADPVAYMMIEGERSVYTSKDAFLEDFLEDPATFRLRRFMRLDGLEITQVDGTLHRPVDASDDLQGQVTVRKVGDVWQWADGIPVPGSTPRRLAMRAGAVDAEEFIDDAPASLATYGLDAPLATLFTTDQSGIERTLLVGDQGPSRVGHEDREIIRHYMKLAGEPAVYLADKGVLDVLEDALREHSRKSRKDDDKAERLEAMEEARKAPEEIPE